MRWQGTYKQQHQIMHVGMPVSVWICVYVYVDDCELLEVYVCDAQHLPLFILSSCVSSIRGES